MTKRPFRDTLQLTNNGQLSLFFVGTGSAFSKTNFQTNLVVIKGKEHVLIDCGTLCSFVLKEKYNTDISTIKNLILTHPHADHIGGLEEVSLVGKYITKTKPNVVIPKEFEKKLWKESLRGGIQFSETGKMKYGDYFNTVETKRLYKKPYAVYEANLGNLNIKLFRTRHVTTNKKNLKNSQLSYGVLLDEKILFTGDTQFNFNQLEWLLETFPTIEYIFHDCDISGYSSGVHASYEQLCSLPKDIKKKTYLCHYNEAVNKIDAMVDGFMGLATEGVYYDI